MTAATAADRPTLATDRGWAAGLAGSAVLAAVVAVAPRGWPWAGAYLGAAWLVPVAVMVGLARHRPRPARPFGILAAGFFLNALANTAWLPAASGLAGSLDHPGLGDALFLAGYGIIVLGLGDLAAVRGVFRRVGDVVDTLIVVLGAAVVAYPGLIGPVLRAPEGGALAVAVALGYPVIDLTLLGMATWIALSRIRPTVAAVLGLGFIAAQLLADAVYARSVIDGSFGPASPAFGLWAGAYVCATGAALHPSLRDLPIARQADQALGRRRLVPLVAAALAGPVVTALDALAGGAHTLALAGLALAVISLASVRVYLLTVDLEAHRGVLADLDAAQTRFRDLVERVPAVTWSATIVPGDPPSVRDQFVSPQIRDLSGHTASEFVAGGLRWDRLVHPDDRTRQRATFEANLARALEEGIGADTFGDEYRIRTTDGRDRWIRDDVRVVRDADGRAQTVNGIVLDVTEERQLREALGRLNEDLEARIESRTAEIEAAREEAIRANRAKSEFLSSMSHELRTPLNAILGFGQLLQMSSLAPADREGADEIVRAGRRLLGMIDEVLEFSRIETGRITLSIEPLALGPIIREAVDVSRPLAAERDVAIDDADQAADAVVVLADRRRLEQILLNLLSNAAKFSREGGRVSIGAEVAGDRVLIRVRDTGVGIAPDRIAGLFEPFESSGGDDARRTTGLGLPLSSRLATLMGGTLSVISAPGVGSTFTVDLPAATGEAAAARPPQAEASADLATDADAAVILYIEDNLANLHLVERVVTGRLGVRMLAAMQGRLGLELAREHRPDLILLDVHLPDAEPSDTLLALKADERTASIPVVVLSSDGSATLAREMRALGAAEFLAKPFDMAAFLAVVDRHLGGP